MHWKYINIMPCFTFVILFFCLRLSNNLYYQVSITYLSILAEGQSQKKKEIADQLDFFWLVGWFSSPAHLLLFRGQMYFTFWWWTWMDVSVSFDFSSCKIVNTSWVSAATEADGCLLQNRWISRAVPWFIFLKSFFKDQITANLLP